MFHGRLKSGIVFVVMMLAALSALPVSGTTLFALGERVPALSLPDRTPGPEAAEATPLMTVASARQAVLLPEPGRYAPLFLGMLMLAALGAPRSGVRRH